MLKVQQTATLHRMARSTHPTWRNILNRTEIKKTMPDAEAEGLRRNIIDMAEALSEMLAVMDEEVTP